MTEPVRNEPVAVVTAANADTGYSEHLPGGPEIWSPDLRSLWQEMRAIRVERGISLHQPYALFFTTAVAAEVSVLLMERHPDRARVRCVRFHENDHTTIIYELEKPDDVWRIADVWLQNASAPKFHLKAMLEAVKTGAL